MGAIPILKASWTLIFGLCEGAFLLRKITITVDDGTLDCLRAFREVFGISHSAVIRRAVWAYYQISFLFLPSPKNRPSVCIGYH